MASSTASFKVFKFDLSTAQPRPITGIFRWPEEELSADVGCVELSILSDEDDAATSQPTFMNWCPPALLDYHHVTPTSDDIFWSVLNGCHVF